MQLSSWSSKDISNGFSGREAKMQKKQERFRSFCVFLREGFSLDDDSLKWYGWHFLLTGKGERDCKKQYQRVLRHIPRPHPHHGIIGILIVDPVFSVRSLFAARKFWRWYHYYFRGEGDRARALMRKKSDSA